MLRTKIYPYSQDTYRWGERKEFCSSCTFNVFGILAAGAQHGSDYFQKVMEDEELLKAICMQGSGAMQKWAGTVLTPTLPREAYLARPDEVAEASSIRKDLDGAFGFVRYLLSQCSLNLLVHSPCDLQAALCEEILKDVKSSPVAGEEVIGYIIAAGDSTKTSVLGLCQDYIVHIDTHRRVVNCEYGQERCKAVMVQPEALDTLLNFFFTNTHAYYRFSVLSNF